VVVVKGHQELGAVNPDPIDPSTTSFAWQVSGDFPDGDDYQILVGVDPSGTSGTSQAYFRLKRQICRLQVRSLDTVNEGKRNPEGQLVFQRGQEMKVAWTNLSPNRPEKVDLTLKGKDDTKFGNGVPNNEFYFWDEIDKDVKTGDYVFMVSLPAHPSGEGFGIFEPCSASSAAADESDEPGANNGPLETIYIDPVPSSLRMNFPPASSYVARRGQEIMLSWASTGKIYEVSVDLHKERDKFPFKRINNRAKNDDRNGFGVAKWTVPEAGVPTGFYQIKLTSTYFDKLHDSVSYLTTAFKVDAQPDAVIKLLRPNGARTYQPNDEIEVVWSTTGGATKGRLVLKSSGGLVPLSQDFHPAQKKKLTVRLPVDLTPGKYIMVLQCLQFSRVHDRCKDGFSPELLVEPRDEL
jgi:hypothetical protein